MVYYYSFPSNERESELIILKSTLTGQGFVFALKDGEQTKGIASVHFLKDISMTFLVYFAITPSLQGKGIASRFLNYIEDCCKEYWQSKNVVAEGMIWEVKKDADNEPESKGLKFFKKNGGTILPCNYMQPPVDGKNAVEMYLMHKSDNQLTTSTSKIIQQIYFDKYHKVNDIEKETIDQLYQKVITDFS